MLGRWICYLGVLGLSFVFFCFFQEWFSWILLVALLWLPLLSLLLSLPALLTAKVAVSCPAQVRTQVPARITLDIDSVLIPPVTKSKVALENSLTGERFIGYPGEHVPTGHCGLVTVRCHKLRIYDYLGFWGAPLKKSNPCKVYVMPKPIPGQLPPAQEQQVVTSWKPKRGGGYAENHDLRLYRPGDDLRNVHWKLSAKTGKLIYREAMEPVQQKYLLQMTLCGDGDQLDRKLGKLLWLSQRLLEQGRPHGIHCTTGAGLLELTVTDAESQEKAICRLLESRPAPAEHYPVGKDALWQCYIGGEADG